MRSRLAFSIACLVDPDILILDEVLAVGDGGFRKKSGDIMRKILHSGVTGILVSHSADQIRELCNKVLWLDHGKQVAFTDNVDACIDSYELFLMNRILPRNDKDIVSMSKEFKEIKEKEIREKKNVRIAEFEELIKNGNEKEIASVLSIIKQNRPNLL